uniref:DNA/RNA non-specific endonuclease/pyrophosphatase/phosphodiesterase domain-containing protein n=1 Tax=Glossina austeni TaxID=7395 RepID=A0A1A9VC91_GLOAU
MALKLVYGVFTLALLGISSVNADCTLKIPDNVENEKTPVIMVRKSLKTFEYDLFQPTGQETNFPERTELLLACTGDQNYFKNGEESVSLFCQNNEFDDGQGNGLDLFTCVKTPTAELRQTNERCSLGDLHVYDVVYRISENELVGPVYDICYNKYSQKPAYSRNIINGAAVNYRVPESETDLTVSLANDFTTRDVNNYFKLENQKQRFRGYTIDGKPLVDDKNFFAPGQLAPDTSMITPADKLSTYDYANIVPQYKTVYDGNVWRVENITRDLAVNRQAKFEVYTGGYKRLTGLHNGKEEDIFLSAKKYVHEIPKYIYKFVVDKENDAGIVFFTLNNPHVKNVKETEFCKNQCEEANVLDSNLKDWAQGYTFCCTWNNVKDYVRALPQDIIINNLLKFD